MKVQIILELITVNTELRRLNNYFFSEILQSIIYFRTFGELTKTNGTVIVKNKPTTI